MYVKQVKRKCNVRGCKNTDCFAISRTREVGNTIIACKDCLRDALGAVDEIDPRTKSNIPVANSTAVPPLFFNAEAFGKTEEKDGLTTDENSIIAEPGEQLKEDVQAENAETDADNKKENIKCDRCGKAFGSTRGLQSHLRYCRGDKNETK